MAPAEPNVLYVSQSQIRDRRFMRQSGIEILQAIRDGKIAIDDSRAVKDVTELKTFLTPKATPAPKVEPKQAPKRTTEATQAQAVDRRFLRQVEQEWASEGGYLKNVSNGNIKIV